MRDFVAMLPVVNDLADGSPGFVWRLKTDSGDATQVRAFDDPRILVNLSVWTSIEALEAFVYTGEHLQIFRRRDEWFRRSQEAAMCMWWIPPDSLPTVAEAELRLTHLRRYGSTSYAFTFADPFSADGIRLQKS
jgi:hypothetical protein